jgi:hypothetical protein
MLLVPRSHATWMNALVLQSGITLVVIVSMTPPSMTALPGMAGGSSRPAEEDVGVGGVKTGVVEGASVAADRQGRARYRW